MEAKNQLSRRKIRVKIFEMLYGQSLLIDADRSKNMEIFQKNVKLTEASLTAVALYITEVFSYTLIHANKQASKLLQSSNEDVDTSLARVSFIQKVQENPSFVKSMKEHKLAHFLPKELIKKVFFRLKETEEYRLFHENTNDPKMLENLVLRTAEFVLEDDSNSNQFFEGHFMHWEDDIEWVVKWLPSLAKKPELIAFSDTLDEERKIFAKELMRAYYDKEDYLMKLIQPKLKNWEAERVALIDLILIKMGLVELLFFPEIPIKVSINEYIDIAKKYSTDHSGQFVNGVLDNLRKELESSGDIRKFDKLDAE